MTVARWQHGLKSSVRCLQLTHKSCTTTKLAVERARRHASDLAGGHVSALFNQVQHNGLDCTPLKPAAARNCSNDKRGKGWAWSSKRSAGRSPSRNHAEWVCTHPTRRRKQGHTTKRCWTRSREARLAREASVASEASSSTSGALSAGGKEEKKRKKRKPSSEDEGTE